MATFHSLNDHRALVVHVEGILVLHEHPKQAKTGNVSISK